MSAENREKYHMFVARFKYPVTAPNVYWKVNEWNDMRLTQLFFFLPWFFLVKVLIRNLSIFKPIKLQKLSLGGLPDYCLIATIPFIMEGACLPNQISGVSELSKNGFKCQEAAEINASTANERTTNVWKYTRAIASRPLVTAHWNDEACTKR